ncbi:venom allergen 5-like [Anthonomus grandis grandis]|uniref:venom allergen 5-like n=1 Tax=Anthonomus grandis grandis TaxID=2921223 RepID=UPI0021651CFF|nr:venom allergen 5-like [Anthonomus grandis grandis]
MKYLIASFLFFYQLLVACNGCDNGVYEYGVSEEEQELIVKIHNDLRLKLAHGEVEGQPKAINLKRISWDSYLAGKAQDNANTCDYHHDTVEDARFQVGQNIAEVTEFGYVQGANWTDAILLWWSEHLLYHYPDSTDDETGHYTQVAWADTYLVGCGYTQYPIEEGEEDTNLYYVCNYGPSGNWPGQPPYETGDSGCEDLC